MADRQVFGGARATAMMLALLLLTGVGAWFPTSVAQARGGNTKYSICHRTNAVKNPYRRINVAWAGLATNAHGGHTGPVFNLADPEGNKTTKWGDIFSHRKNITTGQLREINWPGGRAIFEGATFSSGGETRQACRLMTTTQYVRSEHEAGIPLLDIMKDLDDQQALSLIHI